MGLDVATGEVVHLLDTVVFQTPIEKYVFQGLPTDSFTNYDAKRQLLFGFHHWEGYHWQIDLASPNPVIKLWSLVDEMKRYNAFMAPSPESYAITETHVFFPVGSIGGTIPQVFAFNRETFKIDWQYKFEGEGQYFTPTKVEVSDTHLYVLDNGGTLHIFEKE